jgi:hypothetical protein
MMRMIAAGIMVSAALAAPAAAYAQGDQQQPGGGYVKRVQPREHERIVFTENVGYVPSIGLGYRDDEHGRLVKTGQETSLTVKYDPRHAINIDGGLIVMLNRSWGVGGSYTIAMFDNFTTSTTAAVLGRDNDLEAYGRRKEKTARLELTRVLLRRESRRDPFDEDTDRPTGYIIRVFGGPAYQRIKQNVVIYKPAEPDEVQGSGWGYHAGLDFSMYTGMPGLGGGGIGFGGTARYSRGSVKLPGLLDSVNSDWPAGGWSFGGGIRFRY